MMPRIDQDQCDNIENRREVTKRMPVVLAVNKCESDKNGAYLASQFWNLGLGEPHAVSALHGVGTAELLEDVFDGIVEKGSAIKGFGTKVKAAAAQWTPPQGQRLCQV